MIAVRKYFRLLPAIVIVGGALLALKAVDLARAAQSVGLRAPNDRGLAPSDLGGIARDLAADTPVSAAEVDVLASLMRRRAELDARERALKLRENLLAAAEGRVEQNIASLQTLQNQIQGLLAQRDAAQDKQIAALVKTYSSMKAKDAAHIFDTLADDVLVPVAKGMKSDVLAPVLGAMNRDAAQHLTVRLATLLKLPEAPECPMKPEMAPMMTAAHEPTTPAAPHNETTSVTPAEGTPAATAPTAAKGG